jgi:hypothetical protein
MFGTKKPGRVRQLEFDMANRRLTWALPVVTVRQHPIERTEIAFRVDTTLPWTVQTSVLEADIQELLFADVPVGDMFYRAVVIDTSGARGNDAVISASGAYDPPGAVTNFIATEE